MPDLDPHQSRNSEAVKAKNRATVGNGGVEAQNGSVLSCGGSVDHTVVADLQHFDEVQDPDPDPDPLKNIQRDSGSGSASVFT
jgi:hypothetical protein